MVNVIEDKGVDDVVDVIINAIKKYNSLTITEIVNKTKVNRSAVRTALARLDGAGKVSFRQIGMAKVYSLK